MIKTAAIALLFLFSLIVEVSLLRSFTGPISAIPFLFMVSIVVMHRSEPEYGPIWLVASAMLLPAFGIYVGVIAGYLVSAPASFFFAKKLFATRSVYALLGLGISTYAIFSFVRLVVTLLFMPSIFFSQFIQAGWGMLLLVVGLYVGYMVARELEQRFGARFYIR